MSVQYKNNGKARASRLTIHRKFENVDISGYPIVYDMKQAISGYPALSDLEFRKLSDQEYADRRAAFISIAEQTTGYKANTDGSEKTDITLCPIGIVNNI